MTPRVIILIVAMAALIGVGTIAVTLATTGENVTIADKEVVQEEFGDGSICADYEPGETPPAHLNCDELNETDAVVEEEQPTAIDNMPTIVGRQPDIAGPAAEQCKEPLDNAFEAILKTDQYMEFAYLGEHVQEVYCNDVHVIIPGIPYSHNAYVLQKYPDRAYLNPAAYTQYDSEQLAVILFHEARHLEQYKECKADRSLCMTSEERELDAQRFEYEMWSKLFPYDGQDRVIVIPPMESSANIVILNNNTETITPRTEANVTVVTGNDSSIEPTTTLTLNYRPVN